MGKKEGYTIKTTLITTLFLIISCYSVIAETKTVEKMTFNSKETVNGKTITILDATAFQIKVDVDGKKDVIDVSLAQNITTANINQMIIEVVNYTYEGPDFVYMTLKLTVEVPCGDGICDTNRSESSESCCKDCNCTRGFCIDNVCRGIQCREDKDCDDRDSCTIEKCEQFQCDRTTIKECVSYDRCCPEGCSFNKGDKDCPYIGECESDEECDDKNACTKDICEGKPTNCTHIRTEGCSYKGKCYKINERVEDVYCTTDGMQPQKENLEKCEYGFECKANECQYNLCGKRTNKSILNGLIIASIVFIFLMLVCFFLLKSRQ
ncbi:MAG: hypothetical protein QW404_00850 [Candidatus Nanoarchaeia archaeon]